MENETNAHAVIEAMKDLHDPTDMGTLDEMGDVLVIPRGMQVVDTKQFRDARLERPERRKGTAHLTTIESFVEHARRFADRDSVIFAIDNPKAPKLLAVFDYHEAVETFDAETGARVLREGVALPRFGQHRAEYAFPLSDEWKAWTGVQGKWLPQAEFAAWLEERALDVRELASVGTNATELAKSLGIALAGPSSLLNVAKGLALHVDHKVTQAVNLTTGESQVHFEETHREREGGGPVKVPGGFAIGIPVFRNGAHYVLPVRLRYRVAGGQIAWSFTLHRVDATFDDAFREACTSAERDTGLDLFFGTPES